MEPAPFIGDEVSCVHWLLVVHPEGIPLLKSAVICEAESKVKVIKKVAMINCNKGEFLVMLKSFARIYEEMNKRLQFLRLRISE